MLQIFLSKGEAKIDCNPLNKHGVNEFREPMLWTKVFPLLFPDGKGDPTVDGRLKQPTLSDFARYLTYFAERTKTGEWFY